MKVTFSVLGEARGKQRPRMTKEGHTYTPKETVQYENLVRMEYRRQCRDYRFADDAVIDMRILIYCKIPKSVSAKKRQAMLRHEIRPCKKPDVDNIAKCVIDSISGVAFRDDVQVVDCQIRKFYSDNPRVIVTVQEADLAAGQCDFFNRNESDEKT